MAHAVADEVGDGQQLQTVLRQNSVSCGRRAMVPSSFMISQMTPAALRPAMRARSTRGFGLSGADEDAAVAGAQREDVAGAGEIGGRVSGSMAVRIVVARSAALMPVVMPTRVDGFA